MVLAGCTWDLIIGLLFCFSSPWVSIVFHLTFFHLSLFGFLFIFHGHKIGRHLVLGTGNGAKTSCTLLVIRFYYAGQVLDGWALGHGCGAVVLCPV